MSEYYDRDGSPMTMEQWATALDNKEKKRVAKTKLGLVTGSTIWLGIDHSWGYGLRPLIFETMVFGGPHDQWMARHSTEQDAITGHKSVVARLQAGEPLEEVQDGD